MHGALPAPLNYKGFPKNLPAFRSTMLSAMAFPAQKTLRSGDILNIDVTVILDSWYGDTSRMFFVGTPSVKAKLLSEVTYECMMRGIAAARAGNTLGDIGHAIQSYAEAMRFSVVRDFTGHGLGQVFHCAPTVLHYGNPGTGLTLEPGMFFTIEPMINAGKADTKILGDGWTAVTRDKSLCQRSLSIPSASPRVIRDFYPVTCRLSTTTL